MNTDITASPDTDPFEKILPRRWLFRPKEVAAALALSESTVEKFMDLGMLYGHSFNAGAGVRQHRRIVRPSIVTLLLQTRNFEPAQQVASIVAVLRRLSREDLAAIHQEVLQLVSSSGARPPSAPERRNGNI